MPCIVHIFGSFRGTWKQPNENPGALFWCTADIFWNITYREIQRPGMLVARKIGQVSLVGCTNDWHKCRSGRKLILHIPPPVASVHHTVYSVTFRVCEAYWFKIQERLKWEMCQKEPDTFENIPVV